jgi:hypothetical protein
VIFAVTGQQQAIRPIQAAVGLMSTEVDFARVVSKGKGIGERTTLHSGEAPQLGGSFHVHG